MSVLSHWLCMCSTLFTWPALWDMSPGGNIINFEKGQVTIGQITIDFFSTFADDYPSKKFETIDPKKNVAIASEFLSSIDLPKEVARPGIAPVAAIYYVHAFQPDREHPVDPMDNLDDLIIVIWPDGQILWSDNLIAGGPPYSVGKIKKEAFDKLFHKLAHCDAFKPSLFGHHILAYVDVGFTRMVASNGTGAMEFISVHELYNDPYYDMFLTEEGLVWTISKIHMYDLTKQAAGIKRIGENTKKKPRE
jgi:hypothetical protein